MHAAVIRVALELGYDSPSAFIAMFNRALPLFRSHGPSIAGRIDEEPRGLARRECARHWRFVRRARRDRRASRFLCGNELHRLALPRRGAMPVPTIADAIGDGALEIVVSLKDAEDRVEKACSSIRCPVRRIIACSGRPRSWLP